MGDGIRGEGVVRYGGGGVIDPKLEGDGHTCVCRGKAWRGRAGFGYLAYLLGCIYPSICFPDARIVFGSITIPTTARHLYIRGYALWPIKPGLMRYCAFRCYRHSSEARDALTA